MRDERSPLADAIDNAIDNVARSMTAGVPSTAVQREVRSRIRTGAPATYWRQRSFALVGLLAVFAVWLWPHEQTVAPSSESRDVTMAASAPTPPRLALREDTPVRTLPAAQPIASRPVLLADASIIDPVVIEPLPITMLVIENSVVPLLEIEPVQIDPLDQLE